MRSAVDFPEPDGPTRTVKLAVGDVEVRRVDGLGAVGEDLADALERDAGHALRTRPHGRARCDPGTRARCAWACARSVS